MHDLGAAQRHHATPVPLDDGTHCGHPEPGRKHAVEGGRGAAALDVTEGGCPRLDTGLLFDDRSEQFADSAEAGTPERVEATLGVGVVHGVERKTLGDDNKRCAAPIVGFGDPLADLFDRGLPLRNQDDMGTRCHAGVQRDPADVSAHDLCDHAAIVSVTGGAQTVHRLGRNLHGGVKPEGVVGRVQVVVDRLWHSDDLHALVGEPLRGGECSLSADRNDCVDAVLGHDLVHSVNTTVALEGVRAGSAENRAALLADALDLVAAEGDDVVLDHTAPAVSKADELELVDFHPGEHRPADDRVQAGCVAAAREDSDSHTFILPEFVACSEHAVWEACWSHTTSWTRQARSPQFSIREVGSPHA